MIASTVVALVLVLNVSAAHAGAKEVVRIVYEIVKPSTAEAATHDGKGNKD